MQDDGDARVTAVGTAAAAAIVHTAPPGEQKINRQVDSLQADWRQFGERAASTAGRLQVALSAWLEFDALHDALGSWLAETEAAVREQKARGTAAEKAAQADALKVGCDGARRSRSLGGQGATDKRGGQRRVGGSDVEVGLWEVVR